MKKVEKQIELAGKNLTLSTGHIAQQANAAVLATYGDTVVLATVVASPLKVDLGYFPLSVEYQERLYAGGRIKGSRWVKREGRPTDDEILTARLVDRSIRPLFPKEFKKDVQVILTVLSVDLENSPDVVAGIAASAALAISDIPWKGPIGLVRVGRKNNEFLVNPLVSEMVSSDMDLLVSSTDEAIVMIEAGANQVPEETMLEGIAYAQKETKALITAINELAKEVGNKKEAVEKVKPAASLEKHVKESSKDVIKKLITLMATKEAGYTELDAAKYAVTATVDEKEKALAGEIFESLFKKDLRDMLLKGKRPDGRKADELRELTADVSILPRTHGSAIFKRGATQVLSIVTLGAPSLEQSIETAEGEETKRYMHHYSMPPYSTGETGRIGSPNRREIGHGALGERSLEPVIPAVADFPYAIRVVSEVLSSNGSTSMASATGSTLALMDAGVPLKAPVAGIAMGLIIEDEKKFTVLTDIIGLEDGNGDMDFKVAGTETGITALQMDVKTLSLKVEMLEKAFAQARDARLQILKVVTDAIAKPREKVSMYAPKIKVIKIDIDKIGELIGPGGKTIKKIIAETGAMIDVEDDGSVNVSAMTDEELETALNKVNAITKDPVPGEIYEGVVKRLQPFGAFVEILPGKDGLVHVSDMSKDFVKDPGDFVKMGETVTVRVKEIDDLGRINLSMLLDPKEDEEKNKQRREKLSGDRDRGSGGNYQRRPDRNDRRDRRPGGGSGGPHFPTSRFLDEDPKRGGSRRK